MSELTPKLWVRGVSGVVEPGQLNPQIRKNLFIDIVLGCRS